jgi:GxxExxY protein
MLYHSEITEQIIGAAIEVHRHLGPGLLESAYQKCLAREFELRGIAFQREVEIPITYKDIVVTPGYRGDFIVEDTVALETKSIAEFAPISEAQLLTYLRFSKKKVGLLINFNVAVLKDGIMRRAL